MKTQHTAQHTPGPWEFADPLKRDADGISVARHRNDLICGDSSPVPGEIILCAEFYRASDKYAEQAEANARLISSAPELLAALENISNAADLMIRRQDFGVRGRNDLVCQIEQARAAIAAAKGGAA